VEQHGGPWRWRARKERDPALRSRCRSPRPMGHSVRGPGRRAGV
jgi:hypothetical protein